MRKRIYVIDDEPDIRALVRGALEEFGFEVHTFASGREARQSISRSPPDLCIVDIGLPDMNGLHLVRELWEDVRFGLIVLTGRGGISDRVLGLEFGADDYIVKPFEPRELVARVSSVIRRREQLLAASSDLGQKRAQFGGWTFDIGNLTLSHADGRQDNLTAAEANLLLSFVKAPNRVLSRDQLQDGDLRDEPNYERSIDVRISRLRKKIEADARSPQLIKTVYGAGYLLAADVQWERAR
ncbi:MAG: response regulator transcription factor [Hyphomicrobiaceae bacterium]|nr:response regulator transcription factor [Hyphomicrobiaceae bacterium]